MNELIWQPIYFELRGQVNNQHNILLFIAPFIKIDALKEFLGYFSTTKNLKIIVKWSPKDIISGSSDLAVYPFLKENNIPLYVNSKIHLKLFILKSNLAFHTSANITARGLGYAENPNIEVGCYINLTLRDWKNIYQIIDESQLVDDHIFEIYSEYYNENKHKKQPLPRLILPENVERGYLISSLPASETPADLWGFYSGASGEKSEEAVKKAIHDIVLYKIPDRLKRDDFYAHLNLNFKSSKFINKIVLFIKEQKSCRFGAVNDWIHSNCSDVPLPYRWEIKKNTRVLYNWLAYFYDEITWNIPGKRSQVIYWGVK